MRPTRTSAGLLAVAALLTGCTAATPAAGPPPSPSAGSASPAPRPVLTVAALGDSYTRGFGACGTPGDCPQASWATGGDARVDSLLRRLARARGAAPRAYDASVSGARAGALSRQAARVALVPADLVVVLIGVNDVCTRDVAAMTPVELFEEQVDRAFALLDRGSPQAAVLVLSVPDLGRMADLGRPVPQARRVWSRLGICPTVFGAAADRAATDARRRSYDTVLARLCARRTRCTWDGGLVGRDRFGRDFLAADWFHPSVAGQRRLADLAERALQQPQAG